MLQLPEIHRIDLQSLSGQDRPTAGWDMLRLIVDEAEDAIHRAHQLVKRSEQPNPELISLIETILDYKLPRCTREEIQAMLGITDVELKQTRFYQDVLAEGRQEGRQVGEALILQKMLQRKYGPLPAWVEPRLHRATPEQLEQWADRMFDSDNLEQALAE